MIQILNNQIDSLQFILSEFIKSHSSNWEVYQTDLQVAEDILIKLDGSKK